MQLDIFDNKIFIIMKGKTLIVEKFGEGCQISTKGNFDINIVSVNSKIKTNQFQIC